jgi:4-hydroxy-tetrahydrodipicolinate synthase
MLSATQLKGVVTPLVTPLKGDETLDEGAFRRLIDYVLAGGSTALFSPGSAGESTNLNAATRRRCIEVAVDAAGGRVPVLAGVIAASYHEAAAHAEVAAACGANAAVAVTPFYFTYAQAELLEYFTRLADEIALPLIIYNIPQRTGNPLSLSTLVKLSEHANIVGLKETSENFMALLSLLSGLRGREDFFVLTGWTEMMAPMVLMGGAGGVLGTANIAPHLCVRLYEAARDGDLARVREIQDQMEDLRRSVSHYAHAESSAGAALGGLKLCVSMLGIGDERQCFPGRRPGDAAEMRRMMDEWIARGMIVPA